MYGRSYIVDSGFGSPFDGGIPDEGFGSPGLGDAGFGSPFAYDLGSVHLYAATAGVTVVALGRTSGRAIGEEGGYLLDAVATSDLFVVKGPYRVDFISEAGLTLPDTLPGLYSAVPGRGRGCEAVDSRRLRFSSHPVPPGTYAVRITHPGGYEIYPAVGIEVWRMPWSSQVEAIIAGMASEVYTKAGGPPALPVVLSEE